MRIVRARPLGEYFKARHGGSDELGASWSVGDAGFFYRYWNFFHPFSAALAALAVTLVLSWWYREAAVLGLTLALSMGWIFLRVRSEAHGLFVARVAPATVLELKEFEVEYELRNAGGFATLELMLREQFSGTRVSDLLTPVPGPLPSAGILKFTTRVVPDAGMGPHHFGPLSVIVGDRLGLFQYVVTETDLHPVEVLPEYIDIGEVPVPASTESQSFGLHESAVAGHSPIVAGAREYVQGDSIKSVSWKLSARHRTLIVRELESSVNTDVTLFVDMDERSHIGDSARSTWEWAKDVAISLVHGPLAGVNRIQLLGQAARLEFGAGESHAQTVIRAISRLIPVPASQGVSPRAAAASFVPYGSAFVYVGPVYHRDSDDLTRVFRVLRESGVRVLAVFIDARTFIDELRMAPLLGPIATLNAEAERRLERLGAFCAQMDISAYVLTADQPVRESLLRPLGARRSVWSGGV